MFAFPKNSEMLEEVDKAGGGHVVSWLPSGKAFKVHQPDEFVKKIIPLYFKQKQYKSFQRQLHLYGFLRVSDGSEKGAYYHKFFVKEDRHLSHRMTRKLNGEKTSLQQAKEKKRGGKADNVKRIKKNSMPARKMKQAPLDNVSSGAPSTQPTLSNPLVSEAVAPFGDAGEKMLLPSHRSNSFERFESLLKGIESKDENSSTMASGVGAPMHSLESSIADTEPIAPPALSDFASDLINLFKPEQPVSASNAPNPSPVTYAPSTIPHQVAPSRSQPQQQQISTDPTSLFGLYDFHPFDVLDADLAQELMPSITEV